MKEVKFNDLTLQVHKIKDSINQNIQNVINSNAFIKGNFVKQFEEKREDILRKLNAFVSGNASRCCPRAGFRAVPTWGRSGYRTECLDLMARVRDTGLNDNESSSRRALAPAVITQVCGYTNNQI